MLSKSPFSRVVGPFPNGLFMVYKGGGDPNHLQVMGWSFKHPKRRCDVIKFSHPSWVILFYQRKLAALLLMEEILHQFLGSLSHYLQVFSTIRGGCLGFLNHQQYDREIHQHHHAPKIVFFTDPCLLKVLNILPRHWARCPGRVRSYWRNLPVGGGRGTQRSFSLLSFCMWRMLENTENTWTYQGILFILILWEGKWGKWKTHWYEYIYRSIWIMYTWN